MYRYFSIKSTAAPPPEMKFIVLQSSCVFSRLLCHFASHSSTPFACSYPVDSLGNVLPQYVDVNLSIYLDTASSHTRTRYVTFVIFFTKGGWITVQIDIKCLESVFTAVTHSTISKACLGAIFDCSP